MAAVKIPTHAMNETDIHACKCGRDACACLRHIESATVSCSIQMPIANESPTNTGVLYASPINMASTNTCIPNAICFCMSNTICRRETLHCVLFVVECILLHRLEKDGFFISHVCDIISIVGSQD